MKNLDKKIRITKIIFGGIALLILLVGLFFSGLIAHLDDAPGFAIFGGTMTLVLTIMVYGIGEVIVLLNQNNAILTEMKNKGKKK